MLKKSYLLFSITAFLIAFGGITSANAIDKCDAFLSKPAYKKFTALNEEKSLNFSGLGKLVLSKWGCYAGSFTNGYPNGNGALLWEDGSWYEGEFLHAIPNGIGIFVHKLGWRYKGKWEFGYPIHGKCSLNNITSECEEDQKNKGLWDALQPIDPIHIHEHYTKWVDRYFDYRPTTNEVEKFLSRGLDKLLISFKPKESFYHDIDLKNPERLDSEIKSTFNRYKHLIYKAIKKTVGNVTGETILKITVMPSGIVSNCSVIQASFSNLTEINNVMCTKVAFFDFGPKQTGKPITFTFPIEFINGKKSKDKSPP